MIKISQHLFRHEVEHSRTAAIHGIDNSMGSIELQKMILLANFLFEPVREILGVPIVVSSGYRCPMLNELIGGARHSQHMKAEALDLTCPSKGNKALFDAILEYGDFDQMIWEFGDENQPAWVHVSYKNQHDNRRKVLVAYKEEGQTKYKNYVG